MSDAPDDPSVGATRVQFRPPSIDRYTPRSALSSTGVAGAAPRPARPAPPPPAPGPPARGPCTATSTLFALRGSITTPPMYCEDGSPMFVHVFPASVDLYIPLPGVNDQPD